MPVTSLEIALSDQMISAVVGATNLCLRRARLKEGAGIVTVRDLTGDLRSQVTEDLRPFVTNLPPSQQTRVAAYLASA